MGLLTHNTNLQTSGLVAVLILKPDADGGEWWNWCFRYSLDRRLQ